MQAWYMLWQFCHGLSWFVMVMVMVMVMSERLVFLATCHHIYFVIIMNVFISGK